VIQGTDAAGGAAEQDGAGGDENTEPFAKPYVYNATYIGGGASNTPDGDRAEMLMFRDNTGGFYHNSIFTDYNSTSGGYALTIEDIDNTGSKPLDSRQRFEAGDLGLTHNLWYGFGAGNAPAQFVNPGLENQAAIIDYLVANGSVVEDPMIAGIERSTSPSGGLDPRPTGNSPAFTMTRAAYPNMPSTRRWTLWVPSVATTGLLAGPPWHTPATSATSPRARQSTWRMALPSSLSR